MQRPFASTYRGGAPQLGQSSIVTSSACFLVVASLGYSTGGILCLWEPDPKILDAPDRALPMIIKTIPKAEHTNMAGESEKTVPEAIARGMTKNGTMNINIPIITNIFPVSVSAIYTTHQ